MHYYSIEMTIISAEDLCTGKKKHIKTNAFAIVRGGSSDEECTTTKTPMENGCGALTWNETLKVQLPENAGFVTVEVHCKTSSLSGKAAKLAGATRVPVSDFLGGFMPTNHLQFLSYRLNGSDGERNGIINISVRVKGGSCSPPPLLHRCPPEVGIPVGGGQRFSEVVTGVPAAWYSHPQPCRY